MNQEYLKHDYYTDIITFEYNPVPDIVLGDLFISLDRVKENAETNGVSTMHELLRVFVHGVLHLCGYHDHQPEEKTEMRAKEDFYLNFII